MRACKVPSKARLHLFITLNFTESQTPSEERLIMPILQIKKLSLGMVKDVTKFPQLPPKAIHPFATLPQCTEQGVPAGRPCICRVTQQVTALLWAEVSSLVGWGYDCEDGWEALFNNCVTCRFYRSHYKVSSGQLLFLSAHYPFPSASSNKILMVLWEHTSSLPCD